MIKTHRLTLTPHSEELLLAEIHDHTALGRILGAKIPANWPPESTADALPFFLSSLQSMPDQTGWLGWYAVTRKIDDAAAVLVGCGGFMGPPEGGLVQLGYSVIDQHQRNGYATELVAGLLTWAFAHPNCTLVAAETEWANPYSVRVLEKNGFVLVGPNATEGGARYERRKSLSEQRTTAGSD